MPVLSGIAGKIFGLAVLLLCMTITLVCILFWQIRQINSDFDHVVRIDIPLSAAFADLNEFGLRRRLAFERWYGSVTSVSSDNSVLEEAKKNYSIFSSQLDSEFKKIEDILLDAKDSETSDYGEINAIYTQVKESYPIITARQSQILDLVSSGEIDKAKALLQVVNDIQREIQQNRSLLQAKTLSNVDESARKTDTRQAKIVWLAFALTTTTVLLGLLVAASISRQLVRPIWSLIAGMKSVKSGDLSIQVSITSKDEIGALAETFNFFVTELKAKEQLKNTFGKYVDPRILETIILPHVTTGVPSERRRMTVLFADLVGFTSLGEHLTPTLMVNILNRFFTLQAEAIQSCDGIIDKFIGDAVMAFWGPPFTDEQQHAELSCRAALKQLQALHKFRSEIPELTGLRKNTPTIDMRIGISTGDVVVGNIGSDLSRSYTVIGDPVNIGSRLEGANREYQTKILISEQTFILAKDAIIAREIDVISVKGKAEKLKVYELLAMHEDNDIVATKLRDTFEVGVEAYRQSNWETAKNAFEECIQLVSEDGPSKMYLSRIQKMAA
jgi:class 3 adenylate cyclase